jgi:hypothetical protein
MVSTMPNENEAGEALEAVADAIDHVDDADTIRPPDPQHKGDGLKAWMKQSASLMTHIVALLAAFAAFAKTCDHSITKNAYEALSLNITKLSDQTQKNHDDLVALHGYLDGMAHQPLIAPLGSASPAPLPTTATTAASPVVSPSKSPSPTPTPAAPPPTGTVAPSVVVSSAAGPFNGKYEAIVRKDITFAIEAPPLPSMHASQERVKPPPFAAVEATK